MGTAIPPQQPSTNDPLLATSPTGGAPSGTPTSSGPSNPPEPFKFGANAPAWAQGKTADEVLGIATQLQGTLESVVRGTTAPSGAGVQGNPSYAPTQNFQQYQPQYQQPYQPPVQQQPPIAPDDYVTGRDFERVAPQYMQQYIQPQLQQTFEMMADANLANAKREHPDIFAKYGHEVLQRLAPVPKNLWTGQNLDTIVRLVRGDHVDEIARERAERLVAEREPTLRSGGGYGANGVPISQPNAEFTLQSDQLPDDWKKRAAEVGLSEAVLTEFCRTNYPDLPIEDARRQWFKDFGQTVITEATRRG